ncbi:MAG: PIN/TRAM domain-containing protein [Luteolibacter sp.]
MPLFQAPPSVNLARLTYLIVCEVAGIAIALSTRGTFLEIPISYGVIGGLVVAALFVFIESLMRGFSLRGFSTATFGLGVGLFCAWLLTRVEVSQLIELALRPRFEPNPGADELVSVVMLAFDVSLYASFGFLGAVLALRGSRDDFAFIIPYVRFRQDAASGQPVVLDHEALMDGRIPGVMRAGFLHGRLVVPQFVLEDVQAMVESDHTAYRQRGQRGLGALAELREAADIQVTIHDDRGTVPNGQSRTQHSRMIEVARLLGARMMTMDDNLAKIARLQGIDVLNLNELSDSLKPPIEIGQRMRIALVRPGKEDHQAVGYLPDGTMVVVNQAAARIGGMTDVTVTSTLQTTGGMMIFAETCGLVN